MISLDVCRNGVGIAVGYFIALDAIASSIVVKKDDHGVQRFSALEIGVAAARYDVQRFPLLSSV